MGFVSTDSFSFGSDVLFNGDNADEGPALEVDGFGDFDFSFLSVFFCSAPVDNVSTIIFSEGFVERFNGDDDEDLITAFEVVGFGDFDNDFDGFGFSAFFFFGSVAGLSNFDGSSCGGNETSNFVSSNFDFLELRSDVDELGDLDLDLDIDGSLILAIFDLDLPCFFPGETIGTDFDCFVEFDNVDGDTDLARSGSFILNRPGFRFLLFLSSPPSSCGMVCDVVVVAAMEAAEALLAKPLRVR